MAARRGKGMVEVEGLREIQRTMSRVSRKDIVKEVRSANKKAADVVAQEAKVLVPVQTGRLRKSIGAQAQREAGYVKAGTPQGVKYAGPIHFGWPAKGITPQPFIYEALDKRIDEVRATYERLLREAMKPISSR